MAAREQLGGALKQLPPPSVDLGAVDLTLLYEYRERLLSLQGDLGLESVIPKGAFHGDCFLCQARRDPFINLRVFVNVVVARLCCRFSEHWIA
jgi:hypothetical protein